MRHENKKENQTVNFKDVTVLSQNYFYNSKIFNEKLVKFTFNQNTLLIIIIFLNSAFKDTFVQKKKVFKSSCFSYLKILFFACKCFIGRAGHISRAKKF
jgi:hypothetical protein